MTTQLDIQHQRKSAAWNHATKIPNFDHNVWRWDAYGRPIKWSDHGDRKSEHGWEMDHVIPLSKGGSDHIDNLQALHWEHNVAKSDKV
jgi:5-methylcytosine-specific restriction endonuclease McrA